MTDSTRPKTIFWLGWILTIIPVLMLLMSAGFKFAKSEQAVEGMATFGWKSELLLWLGIVELACTILYVIPHTAVLGAILLTGYLGGAVATHVRIGDPFYMPIVIGVVVWLGIWIRDPRLRALIPIRK
jgi:hypothetical protein